MITALGSFSCTLLEGVTGSGKTEVYLRSIEKVLACGQQVLILVPGLSGNPNLPHVDSAGKLTGGNGHIFNNICPFRTFVFQK